MDRMLRIAGTAAVDQVRGKYGLYICSDAGNIDVHGALGRTHLHAANPCGKRHISKLAADAPANARAAFNCLVGLSIFDSEV